MHADGRVRCTVVERDRTGLLATVAAALALVGFDIDAAAAYSHPDGMALELFTGRDRFGRLESPDDRAEATTTITGALDGAFSLDDELRARTHRYRPRDAAGRGCLGLGRLSPARPARSNPDWHGKRETSTATVCRDGRF